MRILSNIGRRLFTASFFCVLLAGFLNISSAQNNPTVQKRLYAAPIVVYNCDGGSLITNLGSLSGGDETQPGFTFTTLIPDEDYTKGHSGYSLKLDFDVSNMGEYSFYWMKLGKELADKKGATACLNLTDYNYLSFWIKGGQDGGNIKIELHQDLDNDGFFVFDRDLTSYVYINVYIKNGQITKDWQKVLIPLKDFSKITDWSKMIELVFVFENKVGNQKGFIYLDDIIFGYRPEDILSAIEIKDIASPVESSFTVNGLAAKQCPAFSSVNTLEIKAESVNENPFIESVRFEYSIGNGHYKTIGADYDVGKKTYKVEWQLDNTREPYSYKLRAVASDIRGNEKATGVLIECGVKPMTDDEFLKIGRASCRERV